jgi:uncharacterized protein (TIGR03083 family)
MAASNPWPLIHAERAALLADLDGLSEAQWSTPSLCAHWSVHQLLGHMTATALMTPPRFFALFARSGFRFDVMNESNAAAQTRPTPQGTLAAFRTQLGATKHPPGPVEAMLGEAVIHSADIRRPLGIDRAYPAQSLIRVADFYKGSNLLIGAKSRIAGLRLRATDETWTTGDGPEVSGPLLSLILAMTGRTAATADLSGDGVRTLAARP